MTSSLIIKDSQSQLKYAKEQLILHIKYVRYIAMLDNKFNHQDPLWFRKRWTLKFLNCQKKIGGLYYIIYSDINKNGAISKSETLKDPLSKNHIYSYQCKEDSLFDKSKFVLLSKQYGVEQIDITCNSTKTIGQFSFGYDGDIYTKLSTKQNQYDKFRLDGMCKIILIDKKNNKEVINIDGNNGFIG